MGGRGGVASRGTSSIESTGSRDIRVQTAKLRRETLEKLKNVYNEERSCKILFFFLPQHDGKGFQVSVDNTVKNSEFLDNASQAGWFYLCSRTTDEVRNKNARFYSRIKSRSPVAVLANSTNLTRYSVLPPRSTTQQKMVKRSKETRGQPNFAPLTVAGL